MIACSLDRSQLGAQLERWQKLTRDARPTITPSEHGLRLTFDSLPGVEAELESLVAVERRCCNFADWSTEAGGEQLVLTITADSDLAVAAVQGMFAGLRPGEGATTTQG